MDPWWLEMFSMAFALFLLINPIGNIPLFLSVLKHVDSKRHSKIIFRELLFALLIIILFQFLGNGLLRLLKVSTPTVLISGGIILFILSLHMIFPSPTSTPVESQKDPFIVPLATPLVAGPAVLAAVMLYSGSPHVKTGIAMGAIFIAWGISTLILVGAPLFSRLLGPRGLIACERLMGLILTLMAVQMFLEGTKLFLAG